MMYISFIFFLFGEDKMTFDMINDIILKEGQFLFLLRISRMLKCFKKFYYRVRIMMHISRQVYNREDDFEKKLLLGFFLYIFHMSNILSKLKKL